MNKKLNYQFVALPIQCLNLGANELKLFAILFNLWGKYANEEGYFYHSQKKLCNMMGYTERYTRTITHNLEQMGIITVRRHNDGGRNASYGQAHEYKINMDAVLNITPQKQGVISEGKSPVKGGTIVPPSKEKNDPEKAEQNDKEGGTIVPKKAEQNDLPIDIKKNIDIMDIDKENRKEKETEAVTATTKTATDEFIDMLEDCDRQDEEKQKGKTPSVKVEVKVNEERMSDKTTDGEPTTEGITSTERMEEQKQTSTPRVGIGTGGQENKTITPNKPIISTTADSTENNTSHNECKVYSGEPSNGENTQNKSNVLLTAATRTPEQIQEQLKNFVQMDKDAMYHAATATEYTAHKEDMQKRMEQLRQVMPPEEYEKFEKWQNKWWNSFKDKNRWAKAEQEQEKQKQQNTPNDGEMQQLTAYGEGARYSMDEEGTTQAFNSLCNYAAALANRYPQAKQMIDAEFERVFGAALSDNPILSEIINR